MVQKTYYMKEKEIQKKWYLIDAEGKVLGRLAVEVAKILRGKKKPSFQPSFDMGDNVIIINAEKIVLTGKKSEEKEYFSYTNYPGGARFTNIKKYMKERPEFIIEHAIKGMLPKNNLGKSIFGNVKIYTGSKHPHESQKPEKIDIK